MHSRRPHIVDLALAILIAVAAASLPGALAQDGQNGDAEAAEPQPAQQQPSEQQRVEGPSGRFTFPVPADWQADVHEEYVLLTSPEGGIEIYGLAVDEADTAAAIEQGWQRVRPEFDLPVDQTQNPPPSGEVEDVLVQTYETGQDRIVQAVAQLYDGTSYLLLVDAELAAAQRRTSQIQIIQSGFQIAAIEETDLSGMDAAQIDEAMLEDLETYIQGALDSFAVPGAAVAIVRGDEIVYANGFGARSRGSDQPVTDETLMMIGSTTKTMTTMLLADLVAAGELSWDTPVEDILPQFRVSDPQLTDRFLVRHLVCACTGVPRRDLELVFNSAELTAEDVIRSLETFEFFTDFGEAFQYSNQLVATAGYVAAAATGAEFGSLHGGYVEAMRERILRPIGMAWSTFDFEEVEARQNVATPYGLTAGFELVELPLSAERFVVPVAPAGGLWSNAIDMGRYLITHMQGGVAPAGVRVVPQEPLARTWEPQVSISDTASYGLGWIVQEWKGLDILGHSGNTFGFTSELTFLPAADVGIVVLANRRNANAFTSAIQVRFFESLYGQPHEFAAQAEFQHQQQIDGLARVRDETNDEVAIGSVAPYTGRYDNEALGKITLQLADGALWLDAGEFRTTLLPNVEDDQPDTYLSINPPLTGLPVELTEAEDGTPNVVLGLGEVEYTFTPIEDAF